MLKICNCGPEEFKRRIINKDIFIYGAGRTLESSFDNYFSHADVKGIIDKDKKKWGKKVRNKNGEVIIDGIDFLIRYVKTKGVDYVILFITSQFYASEIVEELDTIPELDGLECYLHFLIRNTREELLDFKFSVGEELIPRKIHYIWFGGKELPYEFKKNIETWKMFNPDYEIIRWDETNYDINKNDFIREAYRAGKWSKVANFVRLDIIDEQGGIYLDTDVEVVKNFDCLLNDECFFCLGNQDSVNNGCGLGAVSGNAMIKDMMGEFTGIHFDLDKGGVGMRSAHNFMDPVVKKYGFVMENRYQKIGRYVLYPKEVLSPLTFGNLPNFFTDNTLSIHHEAGSWKSSKEVDGVIRLEKMIETRL